MAHPRAFRLSLEALETRDCPTVLLGAVGNSLFVVGDGGNNNVVLSDNGGGAVTATADGRSISRTGISNVFVNTQGGNDTFSYRLTGALIGPRSLWVQLGSGNDTGSLDLARGVASGVLLAELQGGDGLDTLSAVVGSIGVGGRATVEVNGGKGNDAIDTAFSGELDGWLAIKGSGQDGEDGAKQNITLAAGSTGVLNAAVRGGKGNDRLTLTMNGATTGLRLTEATLDGDEIIDSFTVTGKVRVRNAEVRT